MVDPDTIRDCKELKERQGYAANPSCPVCHGAGMGHPRYDDGQVDYGSIVSCVAKGCLVDQRTAYRATEAYVKEKGVTKFNTFDNFKPVLGAEVTLAAFKDIAFNESAPPLLFVYGTTGNGKTHLCEATATELLKRGVDCRLWTVPDMVSKLKESIPDNTTEQVMNGLKTIPALIMDEWGQNYGSDWEEQKLEEVVLARERAGLITIITSNLPPVAPGEKREKGQLPDRIVSRFRDKSQARLIHNNAPDGRPKKRKKRTE